MNVYVNYDQNNFSEKELNDVVNFYQTHDIKTYIVCDESLDVPLNLINYYKNKSVEWIKGDIVAVLYGCRDNYCFYVSKPKNIIIPDFVNLTSDIVCYSNSNIETVDLIQSLENLEIRAKFARLFDLHDKYDCSVVFAKESFWQKIFNIHVRLLKQRQAVFGKYYHDMLINMSISLYDYKVDLFQK